MTLIDKLIAMTGANAWQLLALFVVIVLGLWMLDAAAEAADDQRERQDGEEE